MRRKLMTLTLAAALFSAGQAYPAAASSVETDSRQIAANGKSFQVKTVRIDLSDPRLLLDPVVATDGIGYDEPFTSMIGRTGAVAAVNGTFFNAYEKNEGDRYPNGLLIASGELVHSGENQSLILTSDKTPEIRNISLGVRVTFGGGNSTYTYFPWGVNKYYGTGATDQFVLYTPVMNRMIDYPNGTKIVIRENVVTEITGNAVAVPGDGYVLFVGNSENNKTNLLPHIEIGTQVDIQNVAKDAVSGQSMDSGQWLAAVGVGPRLVTGGSIDVDFARDGFDDPRITTQASRRSFVGVDAESRLVLGTVDGATIRDAAAVALALGLTDAMNMDGGASSALFASGQMLTAPGRELSNALVVRYLDEPRTQIEINGTFAPNFHGFIRNDTTLVPIRPLLTAMNAEFKWNEAAGNLSVQKDGKTLTFNPDSPNVLVDGKAQRLDTAPTVVDGRLYVPIRYMVEAWGGKVSWDQKLYRVSVELEG